MMLSVFIKEVIYRTSPAKTTVIMKQEYCMLCVKMRGQKNKDLTAAAVNNTIVFCKVQLFGVVETSEVICHGIRLHVAEDSIFI
jgi:hypothetical protein